MSRFKSVFIRRTLVLVLFILYPTVLSRPQDESSGVISSTLQNSSDRSTENSLRYKFRSNFSLNAFVIPLDISLANKSSFSRVTNPPSVRNALNHSVNKYNLFFTHRNKILNSLISNNNITQRKNRLIRDNRSDLKDESKIKTNISSRAFSTKHKLHFNEPNKKNNVNIYSKTNKPKIRRVITKWTDKTKYEDLDFSTENADSKGDQFYDNSKYASSEDISSDVFELSKDDHPKLTKKVYYKPRPQHPDDYSMYPNNIHVVDNYPYTPTRPTYVYATPTPTPIITNVGYPPRWPQQNFHNNRPATTTKRPIRVTNPIKDHYNYHNIVNNYPQHPANNYEVTTFQPTSAYTDRIVIRPEEYSASPDDCPTIYMTLNNTFQGQAKVACPDLNIAVNTNVMNKNVVIESEEDNDNPFADAFEIPLIDDSESGDSNNDYNASTDTEEQTDSASIEGSALTNYNDNTAGQESAEPESYSSPSTALSTISKPDQPSDNDDDIFSFSSIIDFFKPALGAFNWLAALNPLSFGVISFILTPIALLFAGTSGLAALFAPLALSYAREAPQIASVHQPQLFGEDDHRRWQNPFRDDRDWTPFTHKVGKFFDYDNKAHIKPTLFYKFKEWMKNLTEKLNSKKRSFTSNNHTNKRKKRENWTSTIK